MSNPVRFGQTRGASIVRGEVRNRAQEASHMHAASTPITLTLGSEANYQRTVYRSARSKYLPA